MDKQTLSRSGIRSYLSVLLKSARQTIGALAFGSSRGCRLWPDEIVQQTKILADIVANALANRKIHLMLQEQVLFEKLVSDTSRRFVHVPASRVDEEIEHTLQTFVESLGADGGVLYQFDVRKKELYATHLWSKTGTVRKVPEGPRIGTAQFSWVHKSLEQGELLCIRTLEELPEEASTDKESFRFFELKSCIAVPLWMSGSSPPRTGASKRRRMRDGSGRTAVLSDPGPHALEA